MANSLWELFVRVSGDNSGFKKSIKDSQGDLSGFERAATLATDKIGAAFASLGVKMTGAGIGAFILNAGRDFQSASAQIAKATGQVGANLAGLTESFKTLYAGSARSSEEIAGGLAKIHTETKLTGKALEDLTAANLRFAKVTSSDLGTAVDQTQVLFQNWGVATADQTDALDVLYATMTQAGMGVGDLTGQMIAMGPTARAFGLSFVQTAALVGSFDDAGLQASEMVRGLNSLFVKFAEAGKDPKQALIDLIERLKDTKTQAAAVNELIEAGFAKKSAVAMADAARRGVLDLKKFLEILVEAKGKVKEVSDEADIFTDELKKLGHEASLVGGSIGTPIVNAFTSILKAIREANSAFADFETKAIKWLTDKGFLSILGGGQLGTFMKGVTGALYGGWGGGASSGPKLPSGPVSTNLSTPLLGGGGGGGLGNLDSAFKALGLKDLRKELAESVKAFTELAASGKLTHDQMLKAAESIRKMREELGLTRKEIAYDGSTGRNATLSELFTLPSGIHGGATQDDLARMPQINRNMEMLRDILGAQATEAALAARNVAIVTDAFDYFGEHTIDEYADMAKVARENYETMRDSGKASATALDRAFTIYQLHQIELDHQRGDTDDELYAQQKKNAEDTLKKIDGGTTETKTRIRSLGEELQQATHRMFDNISRSIARNLVEWKGWGESLKNIAKTVAEDVLNILISTLLKPLEDRLAGMLGKIGGGGGSTPGVPGVGGGSGGAAGAAGAASSGVMGAVTMVSGVVSAVSGAVSNFQMAGLNKSADLIVNHTLRCFNELAQFRQDAWSRHTQWFQRSGEIWQAVLDVKDAIGRGGGTGGSGKGGITFNNCSFTGSPNEIAAAIFTQAQLAGAI